LGEFLAQKGRGIVPADTPNEVFELYSIPSFECRRPEIIPGSAIGSSKQIVSPGTVLLSKINPRINRAWHVESWTSHTKIASTEWLTFPPHADLEPKYLEYTLRQEWVREFMATNVSGVGGSLMRVKASTIDGLQFPLPDLTTQRSIVAEIEKQFSRLDDAVTNLRRVKGNLKRYVSGVLGEAIAGRLITGSGATWKAVEVAEVGDILLGRRRAPEYVTSAHERKYLRVANIKDDFVDFGDLETMRFDDMHLARYELQTGDVLVSEGQSPEKLGQSAIFRGHSEALCFQSTLHRFRADPAMTTPEFAQIVFRSHVRSGVFRKLGSITTNIGHLTLEKFKAAPFPLPPLDEQQRIVDEVERRFSIVRGVEAEVDANLKRAQALRSAILEKHFKQG
jgi:type I restriction enzyme S subunit